MSIRKLTLTSAPVEFLAPRVSMQHRQEPLRCPHIMNEPPDGSPHSRPGRSLVPARPAFLCHSNMSASGIPGAVQTEMPVLLECSRPKAHRNGASRQQRVEHSLSVPAIGPSAASWGWAMGLRDVWGRNDQACHRRIALSTPMALAKTRISLLGWGRFQRLGLMRTSSTTDIVRSRPISSRNTSPEAAPRPVSALMFT